MDWGHCNARISTPSLTLARLGGMSRPYNATMRVSFNGYFVEIPHTGSGQYTAHLLDRLPSDEMLVARPPERLSDLARLRWEQMQWPRIARRSGADLLHSPYFALPLHRDMPAVVTIHDLIPM